MPSHGRSPDWDEVSSFGETCYAASAQVLGEGPMDIIGHSFGAVMALRLAAEMPERVRSLVLFEPVFFAVAKRDAPGALDQHDNGASPFLQALARDEREEGARLFNRMWGNGPKWDSLSERSRAAMTRAIHVVPDTTAMLYEDTAGILAEGVLQGVTAPTLVMRGEQTAPAVVATNDGLERRLGNAQQVVLQGAGHMGPITHPAEFAAAVSELLDRS